MIIFVMPHPLKDYQLTLQITAGFFDMLGLCSHAAREIFQNVTYRKISPEQAHLTV